VSETVAESEKTEVELRFSWWGTDSRHALTNMALDLFEEKNPGITVVRDFGGFDGYIDKLVTQAAGNNSPDVFQLYEGVLREFASRGQLYDLNDATSQGLNLDGWDQGLLDTSTIDGSLSALQFGLTTQAFIFNTELFEQASVPIPADGFSWEELATAAKKVSDGTDSGTFGVTDLSTGYQVFEVWASQNGESYLTDDGLGFSASTLEGYWQYWADLRASGAATPGELVSEYPTPFDAIIAGKAASGFIFANQMAAVQSSIEAEIAVARMPGEDPQPGSYLRTAMNIAISSTTEHPEEAARLVDFLLNDPEAYAILGIDRGVPANPAVLEAATANVDDVTAKGLSVIDGVRADGAAPPVPPKPGASNVNALFAEFAQEVQFERMSIKDAVASFINSAEQELG
jgi:multiple sugar transport system substrate-binding protein